MAGMIAFSRVPNRPRLRTGQAKLYVLLCSAVADGRPVNRSEVLRGGCAMTGVAIHVWLSSPPPVQYAATTMQEYTCQTAPCSPSPARQARCARISRAS